MVVDKDFNGLPGVIYLYQYNYPEDTRHFNKGIHWHQISGYQGNRWRDYHVICCWIIKKK